MEYSNLMKEAKNVPDEILIQVRNYLKFLLMEREKMTTNSDTVNYEEDIIDVDNYPFKQYTREELLESLEISRKQVEEGKVRDAFEVAEELKLKYGLQ